MCETKERIVCVQIGRGTWQGPESEAAKLFPSLPIIESVRK